MIKASSLTTTKVDRFPTCLPFTLDQEEVDPNNWGDPKNYSVDPVPTFNGIEQTEFWNWLKIHGLPEIPVKEMTKTQGYAIYRANYWLPHCPVLPKGLDLQFFDSDVNQGPEAIRILQVALGVANDGVWGPITSHAVSMLTTIEQVTATIMAFTARRVAVYRESKDFHLYGTDWLRRANEIGNSALKMVAA